MDCVTSPRAKRGVWAERMRLKTATKKYDKNPINIGMTSLALSSAVTAGLPFSPTQLQLPSDACVPSRSEVECEMKQGERKKINSKSLHQLATLFLSLAPFSVVLSTIDSRTVLAQVCRNIRIRIAIKKQKQVFLEAHCLPEVYCHPRWLAHKLLWTCCSAFCRQLQADE